MTRSQFIARLPGLVARICQHLEEDSHKLLLRQLKDWTLEPGKTIYAKDISEVLYGSKDQPGAARTEAVRLRKALLAYYGSEGANDEAQVGVMEQSYKLYDATPKREPD